MTCDEVCWFVNHKLMGEHAYLLNDGEFLHIYTPKSQWYVNLSDRKRFGLYALRHLNSTDEVYYHAQFRSPSLAYVTFYAILHDIPEFAAKFLPDIPDWMRKWSEFRRLWEMFVLGRAIEETISSWVWLSGLELEPEAATEPRFIRMAEAGAEV